MVDELIWLDSPSGNFQVKTVYKFRQPQETQQWKWWYHLWNNGFHERLKFFMWKLCSRGLPVRINLLKRNWKIDNSNCPHGCDAEEDELHLFFLCSVARALMLATPWSIRWEGFNLTSLETHLDWLANPGGKLPIHPDDGSKFFLFAVVVLETLWSLWNRFLFEGTRISLDLEVKVQGVIKLNTDASMGNGFASLGVVARDQAGNIIKINITREIIDSPEAAEAVAIHRAMLLALEAGLSIVCYESDAKAIIQKLNNQNDCSIHWATVGIIKEIIDLYPRFHSLLCLDPKKL
nr:uncharacterized protein LOC125418476 [Ziziphus jujuba var. spinosa]